MVLQTHKKCRQIVIETLLPLKCLHWKHENQFFLIVLPKTDLARFILAGEENPRFHNDCTPRLFLIICWQTGNFSLSLVINNKSGKGGSLMGFQHHYLSTEEQKKEFISLSLKSKVDVLLWRDYLEIL